jgi:hypothetical protein
MAKDSNNGQNGYTNFNNYQPPVNNTPSDNADTSVNNQSQQPPQYGYQPPQGNPYQQQIPYQPYPYQPNPNQQKQDHSLVLGLVSIGVDLLCGCCCGFLTFIGAIVGLIGVINNKKSVPSWIGLILGVLMTIGYVIYFVYAFTHPEFLRSLFEQSGLYDQETINEMMKLFETIILNKII